MCLTGAVGDEHHLVIADVHHLVFANLVFTIIYPALAPFRAHCTALFTPSSRTLCTFTWQTDFIAVGHSMYGCCGTQSQKRRPCVGMVNHQNQPRVA